MSNVAVLPVSDRVHPDGILESARNAELKKVVVIGWTEEGRFFVSGSESLERTIFMLRNAEHELFKDMDVYEEAAPA